MTSSISARIALSIGCPCGIGPEVAVVAATHAKVPVLLVGDLEVIRSAARLWGIPDEQFVRVDDPAVGIHDKDVIGVHQPGARLAPEARVPGKPTRDSGAAQLAWIDAATDLVRRGAASALVTGPVSKEAIVRSGATAFRGHTEHLATRLAAPEVTMAFWTERLTTSLVTTHLPIAKVPAAITPEEVARATYWTADFVHRLGGKTGTVAVAALNPHAGEGGLLGSEEEDVLRPGMTLARERIARTKIPIAIEGPVPAESAFRLAAKGTYDAVVAMYHDQATIPMKLLGFGEAVNITLGLPIVRTSVDHGTAYDRAGKRSADSTGMISAIDLAVRLSRA